MKKLELVENLRGFAACYVALGHIYLAKAHGGPAFENLLFRFGQEAVMVFFLLSGFVIEYSVSSRRDASAWDYLARRGIRIYAMFLLALAVSLLGQQLMASEPVQVDVRELFGNLLLLQDVGGLKPGTWFEPVAGNTPLWSLSYEWWFYVLFIPASRLAHRNAIHYVGAGALACTLCGVLLPAFPFYVGAYFLIWWTGVEMARRSLAQVPISLRSMARELGWLAAWCALWSALTFGKQLGALGSLGIHPLLELRHFVTALAYVVVVCVSRPAGTQLATRLLRPFGLIAPFSYAVYVLHYPVAVQARYLDALPGRWLLLLGYFASALAVAWFSEAVVYAPVARWLKARLLTPDGARRSVT